MPMLRPCSARCAAHLRAVLDVAVGQGHGAELEAAVQQALQSQELQRQESKHIHYLWALLWRILLLNRDHFKPLLTRNCRQQHSKVANTTRTAPLMACTNS